VEAGPQFRRAADPPQTRTFDSLTERNTVSKMSKSVVAVSFSPEHTFGKPNVGFITLIAGVGVEGDAHSGPLVKHRFLVRKDPTQPNLRQVHLIHEELFALVAEQGHDVAAGQLGENITTRDIDLLALPAGAVLRIGSEASIELTGLRNPCVQVNEFQDGLMKLLRYRDGNGSIVRIGGVMAVVLNGGVVRPGDGITVELPPEPRQALDYIVDSHEPNRTPEIAEGESFLDVDRRPKPDQNNGPPTLRN
jgi:MOSC domain-containing protein YiiM